MIRLTTPLIPFANRTTNISDRDSGQLERYFDALATQLVGQQPAHAGQVQTIGITSCLAAEGVSTVARNLALTFAQSRRRSTLLINASGDGANLTALFGHRDSGSPERNDERSLRHPICQTDVENLSVVSTDESSLPSSSIDSQEFHGLIRELKKEFELIVVDMPHADELSGCFAMAGAMDGVVLVVEPEAVSAVDANRAKARLENAGANLLGIVINKDK